MTMRQPITATPRLSLLSGWGHRTLASLGKDLSVPAAAAAAPFLSPNVVAEKLWLEFFSDPSQWWDHSIEKVSSRYPDFKHKKTQKALWILDKRNPPWVDAKLAAMAPGTVQLSIFSWNAILAKYVKAGQYEKTMELFHQLQQKGIILNRSSFVPVLKACASLFALEEGKKIHSQVVKSGCESDVYVGSTLVHMYAKCGSIEDARNVFDRMPTRDVVTWNAMIRGYAKCGQGWEALKLFRQMQDEGMLPDSVTFMGLLNACASVAALDEGKYVHKQIIEGGLEGDVFLGSSLVDMYAKCGSIKDAWSVFNKMHTRDVVAWSAMILGYLKCGQGQKALEIYQQMQHEAVQPDTITFIGVINACASVMALEEGRRIHEQIKQCGSEWNIFVASSLVDMYAKCGSIEDAWKLFNSMATRDVVSWNAMILGFVKCGKAQKALDLFQEMQQEGVQPVAVTFIGVLNACSDLRALEEGRRIHTQVVQSGCESDSFVSNSLVDMYSKCGSIEDAQRVFEMMPTHDVVSWNAIILGYVKCGKGQRALELYEQMQSEGVDPDHVTFVRVVNACASIMALNEGRRIHEQIVQNGFESDVIVGNSLVDMYAKCGNMETAQSVFQRMPIHNVFAWNAMILGYFKCGQGKIALEVYQQMQQEGVRPDSVTFVGVLNACGSVMALEEGRRIHERIIQSGCESDAFVRKSLKDMYAKCGSIHNVHKLSNRMPK